MRIPAARLTNRRSYLDPLNFATNFAFFRDSERLHTRLATANYWSGYGSQAVTCWLTLFGETGEILAEWCESCGPAASSIVLDSREIRARFGLPEFVGQLFFISSALPVTTSSNTRSTLLAGTMAEPRAAATCRCRQHMTPMPGRPTAMPACRRRPLASRSSCGSRTVIQFRFRREPLRINRMGNDSVAPLIEPIPPFATRAVDVGDLLPEVVWPAQFELRAGKHMVRPRYEIVGRNRRRIAHVNVERDDLEPDPELPRLTNLLGKGYLLPAPILPRKQWRTEVLPTPMAVRQHELPIAAIVYDPEGNEVLRYPLGRLPRDHATALDLDRAPASKLWAMAMAMSNWSMTLPRATKPMAGCTRFSDIATAISTMPPRPALARTSLIRF